MSKPNAEKCFLFFFKRLVLESYHENFSWWASILPLSHKHYNILSLFLETGHCKGGEDGLEVTTFLPQPPKS